MGIRTENKIDGICVSPLKVIEDDRGAVLHMLRADSPLFNGFGEVYFSEVNPGVIKGWKRHKRMSQYFAVPMGNIKLVIADDRDDSPTCGSIVEYYLGRPDNYHLIKVPAGLWYAFQNIGNEKGLLANCADLPHDPDESEQKALTSKDISYVW